MFRRGNPAKAIAETAGGAVVTFAEPGGQNKNFLYHWLGREYRAGIAG